MFSYNKFKFRFQRYAVRNLAAYVSVMFAVGYLLMMFTPQLYNLLVFAPYEVLVLRRMNDPNGRQI